MKREPIKFCKAIEKTYQGAIFKMKIQQFYMSVRFWLIVWAPSTQLCTSQTSIRNAAIDPIPSKGINPTKHWGNSEQNNVKQSIA